jgi:hypothetical protein
MGKVVPEFTKRPMEMQLLPAAGAKGTRYVCAAIEAGAFMAHTFFTSVRFDSTGQQPACHHIAYRLNFTRHGAYIAAGSKLVIAFAF